MNSASSSSAGVRFLSFSNDKEDAEKEARLKEAAAKIEQAIAREKSLEELVDYVPPPEEDQQIDPANDLRPLYERLLEQQTKKKEALEESQKLSNFVSKLDEDDINHLNEVAKSKHEDEVRKRLQVFDVLEEQRQLNERKILDEERRRKESLLGLTGDSKNSGSRSTKLKSRLPLKLKMKPKTSEPPTKNQLDTSNTERDSSDATTETTSESDRKRIKTDHLKTEASGSISKAENQSDCDCNNLKIMKCIGVLPSLPIVTKQPDEDDSDNSDDDLDARIVPKTHR